MQIDPKSLLAVALGIILIATSAIAGENDPPRGSRAGKPRVADQTLGVAILSAVVSSDGSLVRGSGALSSSNLGSVGNGSFEVVFDRSVTDCTYVASTGGTATSGNPDPGMANVTRRAGDESAIFVITRDETGTLADLDFHVIVFCSR